MQLLVLIVVLLIFIYLLKNRLSGLSGLSDCQTINGRGDCRTPHYSQNHGMFINANNVGCGSCIYNKLDPSFDGVLPDWQWTLQNYGNTIYKSPPLDSEIYKIPEGCTECSTCN